MNLIFSVRAYMLIQNSQKGRNEFGHDLCILTCRNGAELVAINQSR